MNNQELEIKVKELLEIQNFFDFIEAVKDFEKDYKNTDFYKKTKLPVLEMIKNAKGFYFLQLDDLFNKIQDKINGLKIDSIYTIFDEFSSILAKETQETLSGLHDIADFNKLFGK
jgi:ACT domain-containing protein